MRNNEESIHAALEFVRNHVHEEAKIVVRQAKTVGELRHVFRSILNAFNILEVGFFLLSLGINLPRELSIQKIFTKMYSEDAAEGMSNEEWGIQ